MSRTNLNKKWLIKDVFPYLRSFFIFHKCKKMYILGSRGKLPVEEWDEKLKGKDWDILIVSDYVKSPNSLVHKMFNVDIMYMGEEEKINNIRKLGYNGCTGGFEIFPETPEILKKYLI